MEPTGWLSIHYCTQCSMSTAAGRDNGFPDGTANTLYLLTLLCNTALVDNSLDCCNACTRKPAEP